MAWADDMPATRAQPSRTVIGGVVTRLEIYVESRYDSLEYSTILYKTPQHQRWNLDPPMTIHVMRPMRYLRSVFLDKIDGVIVKLNCLTHWALTQTRVVICCNEPRLFGTKLLPKPIMTKWQLNHRNKLQCNFNENLKPFFRQNASSKSFANKWHFLGLKEKSPWLKYPPSITSLFIMKWRVQCSPQSFRCQSSPKIIIFTIFGYAYRIV